MKVLLTHSYFLRFDPKQWKMGRPYPPLGTLYAAAAVRETGHEVRVFDPMFSVSADELRPVLADYKPDVLIIHDDGFNYLTKMCLTNMREAAFQMIGLGRSEGARVLVCSSDATDHFETYLHRGADAVILGESEETLKEIFQHAENGLTFNITQQGLATLHDGKAVANRRRDVNKHLDQLPFPAWDLVNLKPYRDSWMKNAGYFSLGVSTTRGCPFHCNWCAKPIYGNRYNVHSPQRIVKEIEKLTTEFGASHLWMTDDIFGLKPGWVPEFATLVKKAGLKFEFTIQSRVDLLLKENAIRHLAEAGCTKIWVGAESGSQRILDAMDKGTTVEQIRQATQLMKREGIKPAFFLQFGYPGETLADIRATLDLVEELMPDDIGISVSYPLPGTAFYEKVKGELQAKSNWTDSDDLSLMFSNTFPPSFYKELQRYVHRNFRTKQGLQALRSILSEPSFRAIRKVAAIPFHYSHSLRHRRNIDKLTGLSLR